MTRLLTAFAAVLIAACASAPRAPAFDPVGTYDFNADVQGSAMAGTLVLRRTDQGLAGSFSTPASGDITIESVSTDGRKLLLKARLPDGEVTMNLDFAADYRFTGNWSLGAGMGGSISGTRRPAGR